MPRDSLCDEKLLLMMHFLKSCLLPPQRVHYSTAEQEVPPSHKEARLIPLLSSQQSELYVLELLLHLTSSLLWEELNTKIPSAGNDMKSTPFRILPEQFYERIYLLPLKLTSAITFTSHYSSNQLLDLQVASHD